MKNHQAPVVGLSIATLILVGATPCPSYAQGSTDMAIEVNVDHLDVAPAVSVSVFQESNQWNLLTDVDGQTQSIQVNILEPLEVIVAEGPGPGGGTTVGQRFLYDNQEFSFTDVDGFHLSVSVPEVRPLTHLVQHGVGTFFDGVTPLWMGIADEFFSFDPQVAFLPDRFSVSAYLWYKDAPVVPKAQQGLIFSLNQDVELPEEGIRLCVEQQGLYVGATAVTRYFGSSPLGNGLTVTMEADGVGWVEATEHGTPPPPSSESPDHLLIRLNGVMRAGENVVLLKTSNLTLKGGGGASSGVSDDGGGSNDDAPPPPSSNPSGNCDPPAPPCSATCTPAAPFSDCRPAELVSVENISKVTPTPGPTTCQPNSTGEPTSQSYGKGWTGGVSFLGIQFGGEEYAEFTVSAGACTCARGFICQPKKKAKWEVHYVTFFGPSLGMECFARGRVTTCKSNTVTTAGVCSIPGCGD